VKKKHKMNCHCDRSDRLVCLITRCSHHGQDKTVMSCPCRQCEQNWRQIKTAVNFETVLFSLEMRCERSFVWSRPSFQFATRTCLQTRSHCRQDWAKLFSLQYTIRTTENSLDLSTFCSNHRQAETNLCMCAV